MKLMNKRLQRVFKKHFLDQEIGVSTEGFIEAISELLEEYEQDRYIVERSMFCMSEELNAINKKLADELATNQQLTHKAEENMRLYKTILDSVPEAMMSFYPGGKPRAINEAGLALIGISEQEFLSKGITENRDMWLDQLKAPEIFQNELRKLNDDSSLKLTGTLELKKGGIYQYHGVPEFADGEYIGRTWFWLNITSIVEHQEMLEFQAFHDSLTQLPNRDCLFKALDGAIAKSAERDEQVGVMFIDMDNFKHVNDLAGHIVGDRLIIETANRLKACLTEEDLLGRLGGDEFLLICRGAIDSKVETIRQNIDQAFKTPVVINEHSFETSCSVGLSLYPTDGDSSQELIRKADMAMYQAKGAGKNAFHFFDRQLEQQLLYRIDIERKLRRAIANNEFHLVYQPKISLLDQSVMGVEALIRWTYANGEIIPPDLFIEIAENMGFISNITEWVLQETCQTIKSWRGTAMESLRISVNISSHDLKTPQLADSVLDLFDGEEIQTCSLELELTESVLIEQSNAVSDNLQLLERAGVLLSIDDFGKGYSNFAYLQELNVDYLKIDRSIVSNIDSNIKTAAIARSIIDVGHNLGMEVIAEGVETEAEKAYLKSIGCDYCQGYLFSKPLLAKELELFIHSSFVDRNVS